MIEGFKSRGATIREVEIPELNEVRIAQIVTIATEMLTSLQNHFKIFRQPFGLDTLLSHLQRSSKEVIMLKRKESEQN